MMTIFNRMILLMIILGGILMSCQEDPIPEVEIEEELEDTAKEEAPELTQKVNNFIKVAMEDIYLWYKELPSIDTRYEFDSKEYFDKLLYSEDKWSFVTDDIQTFENSLQGIETTYGYSLSFGWISDEAIAAIVEFVYPNTPAAEAGLKRGDLIYLINNSSITPDNYLDLLYSKSLSKAA